MAEGARLESVFILTGNVGSNPTLSAMNSIAYPIFFSQKPGKGLKILLGPRFPIRYGFVSYLEGKKYGKSWLDMLTRRLLF